MHCFRFFLVVSLLLVKAVCAAPGPRSLNVILDGLSHPVVAVKDGRIFIEREGKQVPVAPESPWELKGDMSELSAFAFWSPAYGISRSNPPDYLRRPETAAWQGVVTVSHQEGVDAVGERVSSEFLRNWPDALHTESALVVVWLLEEQPVKVQVRALPARREGFFSRVIRFDLDERQRSGQPVVLVWQQGRFLPVAPRFQEPEAQAAYQAVLRNDVTTLEPLLRRSKLVKAVDADGYSLLHFAAEAGAGAATRRLIEAGAEIDQRGKDKNTPLHWAAANGRADVVSLLLKGKARPQSVAHKGMTALHAATKGGHSAVVEVLLAAKGVKADLLTEQRQSALGMALTRGYADIARMLARRDSSSVDFQGEQAARVLVDQAAQGHTAVVRLMIEKKTPVNQISRGRGALFAAARHEDMELIEALLAAGAPPDHAPEEGMTPLMMAARSGHVAVVRRLLAAGASPQRREAGGRTALHHAVFGDDPEVVSMLLGAGAEAEAIAPGLLSPLALALLAGSPRVLPALESAGVAHLWSGGRAATKEEQQVLDRLLFLALAADRDLVVRAALDAGWSADARIGGWPLAGLAQLYGAERCAALLKERGAAAGADTPLPVVGPRQLDALPKPVSIATPSDPREAGEEFPEATVKVDFLLGAEGEVLFPRVVESPDLRLSLAVLGTSQAWRFTAPRSEGKPVASRIVLPLVFPSSANRPYDVQDVDELAQVFKRVAPEYPPGARADGETGQVDLKFEITTEGTVENIQVARSSNPKFEAPAIMAARQWRFQPARRDGLPVRVTVMQPFIFTSAP